MSKKIIVTGANGQLGSEIRSIAESYDYTFVFIDIGELDLTISKDVLYFLNEQKPDIIINCAAYTAVDKAEEESLLAFKLNADVPEMLAEYSNLTGCRIIHISTDYVFSGESFRPLSEIDQTNPKSIYGKSKLKGEEALKSSDSSIIIRTSWLYSSFGNNFVKSMIRLFQEKEELKIVYDQLGSPTYAADLASAILNIIDQQKSKFVPDIYHYSNEGVASWYDFAHEIREITGAKCKLTPIESKDYPLPAPRPWYSILSKEKIKQEFKLEIPHWKSSLRKCIKIIN
jgi:dTDP-4-dehydrorhamnose reductase